MDLDEVNNMVYYSDDMNVWRYNLDGTGTSEPLIDNLNMTLESNGLPGPAVKLPIGDIVFARYDE